MTDFTVTITDAQSLAGIADARAKYNVGAAPEDQLATDALYVAHVVTQAVAGWGTAKLNEDIAAAVAAAQAGNAAPAQALLASIASAASS